MEEKLKEDRREIKRHKKEKLKKAGRERGNKD